jgi:Flp pilus assembly protein TadG
MKLHSARQPRRGAAVVELAIVLPLLVFLFVVAIDYCRLFYFSQIVGNCARNGAMYCCDPYSPMRSLYADTEAAALADAFDPMRSEMEVTTETDSDSYGEYARVTVTYPFKTITRYPGIPRTVTITRVAQTRIAPAVPN